MRVNSVCEVKKIKQQSLRVSNSAAILDCVTGVGPGTSLCANREILGVVEGGTMKESLHYYFQHLIANFLCSINGNHCKLSITLLLITSGVKDVTLSANCPLIAIPLRASRLVSKINLIKRHL